MEQRVKTGLGFAVIFIVLATVGVFVWLAQKNKPIEMGAPTANVNQIEEKAVETPAVSNYGIVYSNADFGFEITLPKGWEGYKAITTTFSANERGVYIDLPTNNKDWPGDTDPATGKSMMGYASMFAISVWDVDAWNKHAVDCKKEMTPDCGGEVLAKGNIYVYEFTNPQAMPEDLIDVWNDTKSIKESFKMIPLTKQSSDWQTYRNEKYGFEFQYPNSLFMRVGDGLTTEADFFSGENFKISVSYLGGKFDPKNINGIYGKIEDINIKKIVVDGKSAYMFREGDAGCGGYNVNIPQKASAVVMRFVDCEGDNMVIENYRSKILSTFKFIK